MVDGSIQLTGSSESMRQVTGLAAPFGNMDALPVFSLRAGVLMTAAAVDDQWVVELPTSMLPLQPGTALSVIAPEPIAGPVLMAVNDGSSYPLRYASTVDLMGTSISPGTILSLVFDGSVFQVTSRPSYERADCPTGTVPVGEHYCMDTMLTGPATDLFLAARACGDRGMRLCTWAEFIAGCDRRLELGISVLGEYEWVNSTCNEDGFARVAGLTSCASTGCTAATGGTPRPFRCCTER
jgi:hypothetical protein